MIWLYKYMVGTCYCMATATLLDEDKRAKQQGLQSVRSLGDDGTKIHNNRESTPVLEDPAADSEELEDDEDEFAQMTVAYSKKLTLEDHEDRSDEASKDKLLQWRKKQDELRYQLQEEDSADVKLWSSNFSMLHCVAGVDISFEKENPNHACATLAVLSFPELKVLKESSKVVEMSEPYVPGFLAFREVNHLLERLRDLERNHPNLKPQVILVDGNGILHPNGFGLACHLGVLSDIPCVGVGKKLHLVDGLQNDLEHKSKIHSVLKKKGDYFELRGNSGRVLANAVRTSDGSTNPVYVSTGHKISLMTATRLTIECSRKRVPEPVRMADQLSRKYLKDEKRSHQKRKC